MMGGGRYVRVWYMWGVFGEGMNLEGGSMEGNDKMGIRVGLWGGGGLFG